MKKSMAAFLALCSGTLLAATGNNWLRLESVGPDAFLDGTEVPSGTVYTVTHEGVPVFETRTDEAGWHPESVAQVWDTSSGQPYAAGELAFVLFDSRYGEGAVGRVLASESVRPGEVVRLAATPGSPYEILDTNRLTRAIFVAAGQALSLGGLRTGFRLDASSAGDVWVGLTAAELEAYEADRTVLWLPVEANSVGAFPGTLVLVAPDGKVLPGAAEVTAVSGGLALEVRAPSAPKPRAGMQFFLW